MKLGSPSSWSRLWWFEFLPIISEPIEQTLLCLRILIIWYFSILEVNLNAIISGFGHIPLWSHFKYYLGTYIGTHRLYHPWTIA